MNYKKHLKKKNWIYYLTLFLVFVVVELALNIFFYDTMLRKSIVNAVIGGVAFVALWALLDHMGLAVGKAVEEDKQMMKNKDNK